MAIAVWVAMGGLFLTICVNLVVSSFFFGRLTERVATLEREAKREAGLSEKVTRLEVQGENMAKQLESMDRHLQGMSRQLANLATKGGFVPALTDQG